MTKDEMQEDSKEMLKPILDVMGGTDGGRAFAFLQFTLIPDLTRMAEAGNDVAAERLVSIKEFSRMCGIVLKS